METFAENRRLSWVTFITNTGDFISLFVVLKLLENATHSLAIASFSVGVRALGTAFAALSFGGLCRYLSLKQIILVTQVVAGLLMLFLAGHTATRTNAEPFVVFIVYFFVSILNQWFGIARDSLCEAIGKSDEKRSLIAGLLDGYFSAQIIGSVLSFICIIVLPQALPILLDSFSFFAAAFLAIQLDDSKWKITYNPFRSFQSIVSNPGLLQIFLLRSVGFWIPVGVFNYFRFSVIKDYYHLDILNSVWIDVAIGAGGLLAMKAISRRGSSKVGFLALKDYQLAVIALSFVALSRLALINLPNVIMGIGVVLVAGFASGINAVTTRSIRAKLSDAVAADRPNIIALELIVGQFSAFTAASVSTIAIHRFGIGFQEGLIFSAVLLFVLAGFHFGKELRV